uniref:Maf-like protein n=1 Tax=Quercus lobata TaxID=97700 RepID=A0A7N2QYC5_QUELO
MEATTSPFKIILGSSSIARRKILAEMGYEFTIMTADIDEKCIRKEKPEDLVMALAEAKADAILSKLQTISNQEKDDEQKILIAADTRGELLFFSSCTTDLAFHRIFIVRHECFTSIALLSTDAEAILQRLPIGDYVKDAEPTLLVTCDQVVVYEGVVREKPSSKEEARQFLKDYSGGHAATVGSVLVTNLKTGFRKGEWDRVEIYFHTIPDETIEKLIEEGTVLYVAGGLIIEHPLILPFVKQVVGTTDSVMGLPKALTEKLIKEAL